MGLFDRRKKKKQAVAEAEDTMQSWLGRNDEEPGISAGTDEAALTSDEGSGSPVDQAAQAEKQVALLQGPIESHWSSLGQLERAAIAYASDPTEVGAPPWPGGRQAYRVIRTEESVIMATEGMCWPDPDLPAVPGFGCELFVETPDLVDLPFAEIQDSWWFAALELVAQNVASLGGIEQLLSEQGLVSLELPLGELAPEAARSEEGQVGALVGLPVKNRAKSVATALGEVALVPITLLVKGDLETILSNAREGREAIAIERFRSGQGHLSTVA